MTISPSSSANNQGPLRVLLLSEWFPSVGNPAQGTFVHQQAAALRNLGVDLRIIHPLPFTPPIIRKLRPAYEKMAKMPREESYDAFPVSHPRYLRLPARILFQYLGDFLYQAVSKEILRQYHRQPFTVIHSHEAYPCGYAANKVRRHLPPSVKFLQTIHRTSVDDVPRHNRQCYRRVRQSLLEADGIVFVSRQGFELAGQITDNKITHKSQIITNGVSPEAFDLTESDRAPIAQLQERYSASFNVLFAGNLLKAKGVFELLEAMRILCRERHAPIRLFLAGHDQLGGEVAKQVANSGLQEMVILLGPVPHDQMKIWMSFADSFILPSYQEGVPTVLFEALYAGTPSIFTTVGGIPDIVSNGQEAILIKSHSTEEIVQALESLRQDAPLRNRLSANGKKLVKDHYTWEQNARQMLEVYEHLTRQ